ncbi:TIGR03619 family F420-dependent LLM class oxidoreductase [Pseudonocardia sp.]|uniref:TIGR03619 family F420-dependent LLM class oxidoreductase n=1 Tax=Pseudonocardia sp. TaxID=60912 RepID=UPI003D129ABE
MTGDPHGPRLGCVVPNGGDLLLREPMAAVVDAVGSGGATGLWFTDHLVVAEHASPVHPYSPSADRQVDRIRTVTTPWFEALTCCAAAAAVAGPLRVGTAVLVLPQRHPVEVAKMAATIDRLTGGRFVLGLGAGWLREEFDALGYDYASRADRLERGVATLRDAWTGSLTSGPGNRVHLHPVPIAYIPVLLGGNAAAALRRAARVGDGWLGIAMSWTPYLDRLDEQLDTLARLTKERTGPPFTRTVRIVQYDRTDRDELLTMVDGIASRDVDEIVVEPPWTTPSDTTTRLQEITDRIGAR